MPESPALLGRLGGPDVIERVARRLQQKTQADPRLTPFFAGVPNERRAAMHVGMLTQLLGPQVDPSALRERHARLVERGLRDEHLDAVALHLDRTLAELGFGDVERTEARALAETFREQVLGRG